MLFQPFLYLFAFLGISPLSSVRKWRSANSIPIYNVAMSSGQLYEHLHVNSPSDWSRTWCKTLAWELVLVLCRELLARRSFLFPCQLVTCMLEAVSSHSPPREYLMTSKRKTGNKVERDYKEKRENLSADDFLWRGYSGVQKCTLLSIHVCSCCLNVLFHLEAKQWIWDNSVYQSAQSLSSPLPLRLIQRTTASVLPSVTESPYRWQLLRSPWLQPTFCLLRSLFPLVKTM